MRSHVPDTGNQADPLVSIIIIFLNEERFLEEAIASVFSQSHVRWELLLIDDGSTDASTRIARQCASEHPEHVRYLEHFGHENRGMSASRNLGLKHAHGDYVAFLDADDVWLPQKLEEQVALLQMHPDVGMTYGRTQYWHSWSGREDDRKRDELTKGGPHIGTVVEPPALLTLFLRDGDIYPCMCSAILRSDVFADIGCFEEGFKNANEDMVFHSKVFLTKRVLVADKCWDRYRIHPDSFWNTARANGMHVFPEHTHPAHEDYLKWLERYLEEHGITDQALLRALKIALWPYRHPNLYRLRNAARSGVRRLRDLVLRVHRRTYL